MTCSRCKKPMTYKYGSSPTSPSAMDFCSGCAAEIGIYSIDELVLLSRMLDNSSEWQTSDEFYELWNPRTGYNRDRIRKLILTALRGALRGGVDSPQEVGFPVVSFEVPDRGNVAAEPVRVIVEGDTLIQEFRIVAGPRAGEILTMRTRMVP